MVPAVNITATAVKGIYLTVRSETSVVNCRTVRTVGDTRAAVFKFQKITRSANTKQTADLQR
jgi:hypothetical protein